MMRIKVFLNIARSNYLFGIIAGGPHGMLSCALP